VGEQEGGDKTLLIYSASDIVPTKLKSEQVTDVTVHY
jgi:hypothetical protein